MQSDVTLRLFDNSGNSTLVPLYEGYNIGLSFKFSDIQNFDTKGNFSTSFNCPMTEELVTFFGAIFDPNEVGWFDPRRKIRAELAVDTVPISVGHIQVIEIVQERTSINTIVIQFFGETPDLSATLGDLNISDIEDLDTLNHTLNYDNTQDDNLNSGNTLYFLIDKGQVFSEEGQQGTRPIFNSDIPLYPADFTPAIPARWIWDNIFSDAGFVVDSPSNFPDTLDDLYIPWYAGTQYPISTDAPDAENFTLWLETANTISISTSGYTDITTMTESFDNGSNVASNVFTAPLSGTYSFRAGIYWQKTSGTLAAVQLHLRNSSNVTLASTAFQTTTNNNIPKQLYLETQLQLDAGDTVKLSLFQTSATNIEVLGSAAPNLSAGTGLQMYDLQGVLFGQTVDMVANAPIMRQIDFLRSIAKMFNLVFIPDRNIPKKIRIEPMGDYLQSGDTVDWTGKLDLDTDRRLTPTTGLQASELLWTYKADGDWLNKVYQDEGGRIFGELSNEDNIYFDNLASDFATGSLKVELAFSPTPCANIPGTATPIPKFIDDQGKTIKTNPRILYWATTQGSVQLYDEGTSLPVSSNARILSHFSTIDIANGQPGVGENDLNFGQENIPQEFQQTFGSPINTLFYTYWRDYIRELYDQTSRILTGKFALSISDVLTFSFADRIWVKDSYWRILEINNFGVGTDNTTEVKLLKILSTTSECSAFPSSSNANGTVSFVDSAGSPTSATQECCELYGYTWDATTNTCRWNGSGTGRNVTRNSVGAGTENWGHANDSVKTLPPYVAAIASKADISAGSFGVFAGGVDLKVGSGNTGSAIFGTELEVAENLRGGIGAFGKNANILHPGIHLGGGYIDEDSATTKGRAQSGKILFTGSGIFEDIGDTVELLIEGLDRLVIPNTTAWSMSANVSLIVRNVATGALDDYGQQVYELALSKSLNAAGVTSTTVTPTHEDTSFNAHLRLLIDTTTDTTQHRLFIEAYSATSLPTGNVQFTMELNYVQTLHSA